MRWRDLVERGAEPRDRGGEIFRPFAVEALLMCAEACNAGADLVFDLAVDDRLGRQAWRPLDRRFRRSPDCLRRNLDAGDADLRPDLARR